MTLRRRRNDQGERPGAGRREYSSAEVEALTTRAAELLDELHAVMDEMAEKLRTRPGSEPR
ncbi:hypothetical protein AB5J62_33485 [Amycolatopsis sp. cg5]|uniref:hypothetical protein n=1 Tax=Amycolatopsis sp. cg5 TaxID=3238802 RepID=UPI003525E6DE